MKYAQILREMSRGEAAAIFQRHGVDPMAPNLDHAWKRLVKQHHPDKGGDTTTMAQINAAYDVLKHPATAQSPRHTDPEESAPWAHAGWSGGAPNSSRIYRHDYTDMNFIKKRMWELSGHSNEQWSITGFDGAFTRASLTVYGSPNIFAQMAEALVMWQTKGGNPYRCRAVFVQKRDSKKPVVYLIWADHKSYASDPIEVEYDSFHRNPSNDSSFNSRLRRLIDELQDA